MNAAGQAPEVLVHARSPGRCSLELLCQQHGGGSMLSGTLHRAWAPVKPPVLLGEGWGRDCRGPLVVLPCCVSCFVNCRVVYDILFVVVIGCHCCCAPEPASWWRMLPMSMLDCFLVNAVGPDEGDTPRLRGTLVWHHTQSCFLYLSAKQRLPYLPTRACSVCVTSLLALAPTPLGMQC